MFSNFLQKPYCTNTHSEFVVIIACPLQQWLHKHTSMLQLYVDCLSLMLTDSVADGHEKFFILAEMERERVSE